MAHSKLCDILKMDGRKAKRSKIRVPAGNHCMQGTFDCEVSKVIVRSVGAFLENGRRAKRTNIWASGVIT